jgi:Mg2+ and Co2+ transporter CorA
MLQSQEDLVAEAASRITELELNVIQLDQVRAEALLSSLFAVRHDLQTIWTNAAQTHELYSHLSDQVESDAGLPPIDPRVLRELRQAYGHLRNTTDLEREYLQEVLDLFQTRVSTELNRFVRKITAFGTIAIAWTVITGICLTLQDADDPKSVQHPCADRLRCATSPAERNCGLAG